MLVDEKVISIEQIEVITGITNRVFGVRNKSDLGLFFCMHRTKLNRIPPAGPSKPYRTQTWAKRTATSITTPDTPNHAHSDERARTTRSWDKHARYPLEYKSCSVLFVVWSN